MLRRLWTGSPLTSRREGNSSMTAHYQERFARALLSPSLALPEGIACNSGVAPVKRFGIYRNNVTTGLAQALAIRFPITEKIVGEEFFAAMARAFVKENLPRSPVLLDYGSDFDRFVAAFEPARSLPYLSDIVRLENAQIRAYHAADAPPLDKRAFADLKSDDLDKLRLELHPSAAVVRSHFPIVTIWSMNSGESRLGPIEEWRPEQALVVRPHLSVTTRLLPPGGAVFLESVAGGKTLGASAQEAWHSDESFDLAACLAAALAAGVFASFTRGRP